MAKRIKEELTWVKLNVEALSASIQENHAALRVLFDQVKLVKAKIEEELDAALVLSAAKLPDDVKTMLKVNDKGRFPVGTLRKYAYLGGIAVATATAPKYRQATGGVSLVHPQ